jgi:hypothetical protein
MQAIEIVKSLGEGAGRVLALKPGDEGRPDRFRASDAHVAGSCKAQAAPIQVFKDNRVTFPKQGPGKSIRKPC